MKCQFLIYLSDTTTNFRKSQINTTYIIKLLKYISIMLKEFLKTVNSIKKYLYFIILFINIYYICILES